MSSFILTIFSAVLSNVFYTCIFKLLLPFYPFGPGDGLRKQTVGIPSDVILLIAVYCSN